MRSHLQRNRNLPRSPIGKLLDWVLVILVFGLLILVVVRLDELSTTRLQGIAVIVDGDSLVLNGAKLRLEGIDAPELQQKCKNGRGTYACGHEARKHLEGLISSQEVVCTGWQQDKYRRLLARCVASGVALNSQMVSSGWAVAYGDFYAQDAQARAAKRGVWQGEFERPSNWRKMRGDVIEVPHNFMLKITSLFKTLFGFDNQQEKQK